MTFLTPALALAGLAAVAIPIIIHLLFRQQRKPIEWAAMQFLLEAFRKFRRRLQMEQFLLLAIRCLIVALLGAALARPLLQQTGFLDLGGSTAVYLVIDNGLTSGVSGDDDTTALDRHVEQAIAIINTLKPADTVGLITTARPAEPIVAPPSTNHSSVINLLRSLTPASSETDIPAALDLLQVVANAESSRADQTVAYLLSDFRAGSAQLDVPLTMMDLRQPERITLLTSPPADEAVGNVQVTAIEPVRRLILRGETDGWEQIRVRLARKGGELGQEISRVRLLSDAITSVEAKVVEWSPGQSDAEVDFNIDLAVAGESDIGLTAIIDADRLEADDARYAVLAVRRSIRVVLVERRDFGVDRSIDELSAGKWIRRALEPFEDSPMQFIEVEPAALAPVDLRAADVVVVSRPDLVDVSGWDALAHFYRTGGLVIVTPPAELRVHPWVDEFIAQFDLPWSISKEVVEYQDGIGLAPEQPRQPLLRMISGEMADLTAPVFAWRILPVDTALSQARAVLNFTDGSPLLVLSSDSVGNDSQDEQAGSETDTSQGLLAYFTAAPQLSWSNLPTKPLMVPLFHELVRQGLSDIRAQRETLVGMRADLALPPASSDLIDADGGRIAVVQGQPQQALARAGLYEVVDAARQPLGTLAANINPAAGDTGVQDEQAVLNWLRGSGGWEALQPRVGGAQVAELQRGAGIGRILLFIVLALIVLETLFARWFSHARQHGSGKSEAGISGTLDELRRSSAMQGGAAS